MIGKISRYGSDAPGLVAYLLGPGKSNEHTNPRVIASTGAGELDGGLWYAGDETWMTQVGTLDSTDARELGRLIESDWREGRDRTMHRTPVLAGGEAATALLPGEADGSVRYVDEAYSATGRGAGPTSPDAPAFGSGPNRKHVLHISLSLRAGETPLSDEQWSRVATEYVRAMGIAGDAKEGADCRWVAVHHGVSAAGNDHIHIAASMVRSDGSWWNDRYSFKRSRMAVDEIERKYGLERLKDSSTQRGEHGYAPGAARRAGGVAAARVDPEVARLSRVVRASAAASSTEADWIKDLRRQGIRIRPRFAKGGRDEVIGYSVRLRQDDAVWYGGGRLGRDLRLGQLRAGWNDAAEARREALSLWTRQRGVAPKQWAQPDLEHWNQAQQRVASLAAKLEATSSTDATAWGQAARDTSALWGAYAMGQRGSHAQQAATVARETARAAMRADYQAGPVADETRGAARFLSIVARTTSSSPTRSSLGVLEQLLRASRAIERAQREREELRRAQRLHGALVPAEEHARTTARRPTGRARTATPRHMPQRNERG